MSYGGQPHQTQQPQPSAEPAAPAAPAKRGPMAIFSQLVKQPSGSSLVMDEEMRRAFESAMEALRFKDNTWRMLKGEPIKYTPKNDAAPGQPRPAVPGQAPAAGVAWTPVEEKALDGEWNSGSPISAIATAHNRSMTACWARLGKTGLVPAADIDAGTFLIKNSVDLTISHVAGIQQLAASSGFGAAPAASTPAPAASAPAPAEAPVATPAATPPATASAPAASAPAPAETPVATPAAPASAPAPAQTDTTAVPAQYQGRRVTTSGAAIWEKTEEANLASEWGSGMKISQIAAAHGRTSTACWARLGKNGVVPAVEVDAGSFLIKKGADLSRSDVGSIVETAMTAGFQPYPTQSSPGAAPAATPAATPAPAPVATATPPAAAPAQSGSFRPGGFKTEVTAEQAASANAAAAAIETGSATPPAPTGVPESTIGGVAYPGDDAFGDTPFDTPYKPPTPKM